MTTQQTADTQAAITAVFQAEPPARFTTLATLEGDLTNTIARGDVADAQTRLDNTRHIFTQPTAYPALCAILANAATL